MVGTLLRGCHSGSVAENHRVTGTYFADVFRGAVWETRGCLARVTRMSFVDRCGKLAGGLVRVTWTCVVRSVVGNILDFCRHGGQVRSMILFIAF